MTRAGLNAPEHTATDSQQVVSALDFIVSHDQSWTQCTWTHSNRLTASDVSTGLHRQSWPELDSMHLNTHTRLTASNVSTGQLLQHCRETTDTTSTQHVGKPYMTTQGIQVPQDIRVHKDIWV